ncbi:MAG: DUF1080 domain-containing protein [Deltaproteobacteria bacterium]|nr:DUF1080 domain-containing protein [Deltaproteobacteria bacterium]MBT4640870.1 DUF1080 domain-containing protein [Deltaproteobacteria bacterium]MBT6503185.1 DUF1080 domain-containing protein [Deltaproteobacteria bacterium]MBT6612219.1 DUF1080 domain-containing protein [Deltaproteobacteria bacterium]MBT7155890.1 DUF1080 domain-containing protein [Deltaproteobacteria bacterium]
MKIPISRNTPDRFPVRVTFTAANNTGITPATFVQVILNGKIVQENVPMEKGPTSGSLRNGEFEKGPLMLQGGLGAVAYRNISITER